MNADRGSNQPASSREKVDRLGTSAAEASDRVVLLWIRFHGGGRGLGLTGQRQACLKTRRAIAWEGHPEAVVLPNMDTRELITKRKVWRQASSTSESRQIWADGSRGETTQRVVVDSGSGLKLCRSLSAHSCLESIKTHTCLSSFLCR